jgi:hypothetical protein
MEVVKHVPRSVNKPFRNARQIEVVFAAYAERATARSFRLTALTVRRTARPGRVPIEGGD